MSELNTMPELNTIPELTTVLGQVTEEVLEYMFFSGVTGEPAVSATGKRLCATVSFTGSSNGALGVSVPPPVAAVLAAAFLGSEDEATDETQVRAVVGEIANVICGVVLARMNADGQFAISTPEVIAGEDGDAVGKCEIQRHFEIIEGDLSVGLTVH